MKSINLNTSKLRNTSHGESRVQEMDNALPNHGKEIRPLAGLISHMLCTIPLKHLSANYILQDWFDLNDKKLRELVAKGTKTTNECCRSEAPDQKHQISCRSL